MPRLACGREKQLFLTEKDASEVASTATPVVKAVHAHSCAYGGNMARKKSSKRKYGPKASKAVEREMHEYKRGKLKSGRSGKKVKSRKQAIAIGLSEARREGAKVPKKKSSSKKSSSKKSSGRKSSSKKSSSSRKKSSRKSSSKKSSS
jgi:hypothetical protein